MTSRVMSTMSIDSATGLLPGDPKARNPYAMSDADRIKHNASPSKASSLRRSLSRALSTKSSSSVRNATRNASTPEPVDYYADIKPAPPVAPKPAYNPSTSAPSQRNLDVKMANDPVPARPLSRGASLRRCLSNRFGSSPSRSATPTPQVKVELVDIAPRNVPETSRPGDIAALALEATEPANQTNLRPTPKKNFRWSTGALPTLSDIPEDEAKAVRFQRDDRVKQPEAIPGVRKASVPLTRSATTAGNSGGLGRSGTLRGLFRSKSAADASLARHRPVRSWSAPQVPKIEDDDDEDDDSGDEEYANYARQEFAYSMGICDYQEYRYDY